MKSQRCWQTLRLVRKKAVEGGYVNGHKLDVERLIKENFKEITIVKREMASDVSGKLEGKDGHWIMTVNSLHPEVRQRYTLGHELGHYLNHRKTVKSFEDGVFSEISKNPPWNTWQTNLQLDFLCQKLT